MSQTSKGLLIQEGCTSGKGKRNRVIKTETDTDAQWVDWMSRNPSLGNEKCEFCIRSLLLWATNKMVHNYYKCGIFLFLLILGQIKVKHTLYAYLIFVTDAREEKMCHVETFQISLVDRCWDNWNFSTCRVISKFSPWQMWRNLKSPSLIMNHYQQKYVYNIWCFVAFYTVLSQNQFFGFMLFCR